MGYTEGIQGALHIALTDARSMSFFYSILEEMQSLRMNRFMREQEAKKTHGKILPFVRGLRFSALLTYAIRSILLGTELKANWGHLLDKDGSLCSPECDIIIHRNEHAIQWNGDENKNPIMDFRFIKQEDAIVVISCKLHIESGNVDSEYCPAMKSFVEKVWLFAECCGPRSGESIKNKALRLGYENFWHLYSWSEKRRPEPNKDGWMNFVEELKKLG